MHFYTDAVEGRVSAKRSGSLEREVLSFPVGVASKMGKSERKQQRDISWALVELRIPSGAFRRGPPKFMQLGAKYK